MLLAYGEAAAEPKVPDWIERLSTAQFVTAAQPNAANAPASAARKATAGPAPKTTNAKAA